MQIILSITNSTNTFSCTKLLPPKKKKIQRHVLLRKECPKSNEHIAYQCQHVTRKWIILDLFKVLICSLFLKRESQGASQPTLLWLAGPEHAPSEPSVLDSFPLDLLSPCHSGCQGWQWSKYLPMSATGYKYQCHDTASINYKSLQHTALLAVRH